MLQTNSLNYMSLPQGGIPINYTSITPHVMLVPAFLLTESSVSGISSYLPLISVIYLHLGGSYIKYQLQNLCRLLYQNCSRAGYHFCLQAPQTTEMSMNNKIHLSSKHWKWPYVTCCIKHRNIQTHSHFKDHFALSGCLLIYSPTYTKRDVWINWLNSGLTSHSTLNRSYWRHSSQPISWLVAQTY